MDTIDQADGTHSAAAAMPADPSAKRQLISKRGRLVGAYVALLLFMFIYCARPEDWVPGLSHAPLAKIVGILSLLALLFSLQQIRRRLPREILYLGFLVGQLFLASVLSPVWRGGALGVTAEFAKALVTIVVMAATVTTVRRLHLLIITQAASVAAIAAVTIWKEHLILGRLEGMLGGNYADPNDLALAFVISFPLCLGLLILTKSWMGKCTWALAMLIMIYAIFLTGSRGGFLAFIATGMVCLWQFAIRGRRPYILGLTAVLAGIALLLSGGVVIQRLRNTFDSTEDTSAAYASSQARQELFWRSLEVTREHPVFGVGPGNFVQLSGDWHVAHNSFTQMSSEGGVPALVLYLLILWSGFKNLRATKEVGKMRKNIVLLDKALKASLIGYTVGSCFLSVNYEFFPYFLVAYTTALLFIAEKSTVPAKYPAIVDSGCSPPQSLTPAELDPVAYTP